MKSQDSASAGALGGFGVDLRALDPDLTRFLDLEEERQRRKIILIASESIAPPAVLEALNSPMANLYAEGWPSTRMSRLESDRLDDVERHLAFFRRYGDRRYYKGCEYANFVEALAQRRAAELFATDRLPDPPARVPADRIFVNVQPLSGAAANNAVYTAFASPGDVILGMSLVAGGHLTHGSPVNRSGKHYRVVSYSVDPGTGRLDLASIRALARQHRPKIVIAGYSAYPWKIDWIGFREICDEVGAVLLADIAHPAGLVAAGLFPSPVGVADVTMCTTHKTLCGPRGAILMTTDPRKAKAIDMAVFPGEQGGPHLHSMAGKAVAFKIANTDEFRALQAGIARNAKDLAAALAARGLRIAYGGTETHLLLVDLRSVAREGEGYPDGEVASRLLDLAGITCNKNTIAGDVSALRPSAVRLGTTWITQRGFGSVHVERLAELIHRVLVAIRPFQIQGARAKLGRARIDDGVLEATRADVEVLLRAVEGEFGPPLDRYAYAVRSAPPLESPLAAESSARGATAGRDGRGAESCGIVDLFEAGAVSVVGERAAAFLQCASSVDVLALAPGDVRRALGLDREGRRRYDVSLVRLADEGPGIRGRFLLLPRPGETAALAQWLRALSDGYTPIEEGDLPAKVEGPVAVEDLRGCLDAPRRRTRIALVGPAAPQVAARALGGTPAPDPGRCVEARIADRPAIVIRPEAGGSQPRLEVLVAPGDAVPVWRTLLEAGRSSGAAPRGAEVWAAAAAGTGTAEGTAGGEILRSHPELFALRKPFFVGRSRLGRSPDPAKPESRWEPDEGAALRRTPLFEDHLHRTLKSLLIPFAGWEMPVWYTKVSEEHRAVREAAGLFDVAHMGVIGVRGDHAARFLDLVTTNYVPRLVDGRSHYSYVLGPKGDVLDDIIVYRIAHGDFQVVVNAANAEKILAWFRAVHSREVSIDPGDPAKEIDCRVEIRDLKDPSSGGDRRIDLALQGPVSLALLREVADGPSDVAALDALTPFSHRAVGLGGIPVLVSRTGYTGETFGFELFVHPDRARALWDLLLREGAPRGVVPAGLGARDSTRTEAGFPLYGHELAGPLGIDPAEAGYGSFVKFHKPFFVGRGALANKPDAGKMRIVRFRTRRTRKFEFGDPVLDVGGGPIGKVTSCTLVGDRLIGLAYVEAAKVGPDNGGIAVGWARRPGESERAELLPRFPQRTGSTGFLDPPPAT